MGRRRGCECGKCGACLTWEYRHNRLPRCKAEGCGSIQKSKGYCDLHRGLASGPTPDWKLQEQSTRTAGLAIRKTKPRALPASIVDAPEPEPSEIEAPDLVGHESREYHLRVLVPPTSYTQPPEALPPLIPAYSPDHMKPETKPYRFCDCTGCSIKRRIGSWAS
jgi:hypothetical protein